MKATMIRYTALLLLFSAAAAPLLFAKSSPRLNHGKKWRIAYYEGGAYSEYTDTMRTLVMGLIELGWVTQKNPPDLREEMPKPYVDWLMTSGSPWEMTAVPGGNQQLPHPANVSQLNSTK